MSMMDHDTALVSARQKSAHPMVFVIDADESTGNLLVQVLMQEASCFAFLFTQWTDVLRAVETVKLHLFLLDYRLPDRNGLELYDQLHALPTVETIPAILFSAGTVPADELHKRQLPFLHKPFNLDELIGTLEHALS
jgi:DNA-binding NtrC family response regulator